MIFFLPERPAQLVIVHVGFALAFSPPPRHLVWICEFELSVRAFPRDAVGVRRIGQQLQQELPQLNLAGAWRGSNILSNIMALYCKKKHKPYLCIE